MADLPDSFAVEGTPAKYDPDLAEKQIKEDKKAKRRKKKAERKSKARGLVTGMATKTQEVFSELTGGYDMATTEAQATMDRALDTMVDIVAQHKTMMEIQKMNQEQTAKTVARLVRSLETLREATSASIEVMEARAERAESFTQLLETRIEETRRARILNSFWGYLRDIVLIGLGIVTVSRLGRIADNTRRE